MGKKEKTQYNSPPNYSELLNASVTEIYENKKAILTIISDDGEYQTGRKLKQYSEQYQIPITVAGTVINTLRHKHFWKKAVKEHMFEVVNHSYNHIRMEEGTDVSKNRKQLVHEIVHAKVFFEKIFNKEQVSFVPPENQMCSLGYDLLREHGTYAMVKSRFDYNTLSPEYGIKPSQWLNLYRIGILDAEGDYAKEERNKWIDTAIQNRKWLIEMWHNVSEDYTSGFQTLSPKDAEDHLGYISQQRDRLWVALFSDAIKYIYERQKAVVKAYYDCDYLSVFVELLSLPYEVFDHELTVKIDCSSAVFNNYLFDYIYEDEKTLFDY